MSDSGHEEQARHLEEERARLRRRMGEVAASIADTEEQVAGTLEAIAERRSGPDAERLRAQAAGARDYAAKERGRAAGYGAGSDDG